jgi:hypothetical protein
LPGLLESFGGKGNRSSANRREQAATVEPGAGDKAGRFGKCRFGCGEMKIAGLFKKQIAAAGF